MIRVWHPFYDWEELGMWYNLPKNQEETLFAQAVEFTGDHELYGSYMLLVADNWPVSCEHNLTARGVNHKAWIGHAACYMAIGCPEHITRKAWRELTDEQRELANKKAEEAIDYWHENKSKKVHKSMVSEGLQGNSRRSTGESREAMQSPVLQGDSSRNIEK